MSLIDYFIIFLEGYAITTIVMWFVNFYLNARLYRIQYEIIEPSEVLSLANLQELLQQKELADLDIKIYSSSIPQMIFLDKASMINNKFEKSTLLISSRFFSEPFSSVDRKGMLGFLIYKILLVKHLKRITLRKMSFYRSFLVLIILDILFLILVISLFAPLRGGQFDLQFPLLVWLFINYILIARNGINEMRQIHNADNFAFNLTNEYVEILQKYTKVLSNERSFFQKLLVFLLMITWVKPHIALSKRLWRLNPIHEEIWCPHCSKKLLITQNWCPNCNFNISTPFSYSNFLIWATIACFGFILLPVLILGFFESSSENHIFLILLYSYLCLFLIALVTERIHFQKILPQQPNSILLTFLLGLSLVFATFISFLMDKGLNSIVKESMQYSSVTFFVGFVMGGFILYYLVIELRFRKSTVQWSYSRCPRCSQILSKHSSSCPNCRQQLRTESQMRPEIEVETPTVAMKEEIISPIRFCPTCGTNRIENSSFCITCGYRFSQK